MPKMPFGERGTQYKYYGNADKFLACIIDHEAIGSNLYAKLVSEEKSYGTASCESCGAFVTVTVRGCGEWETKIFSRGGSKER